MIEEHGSVISVEPGAVWVKTLRKSACAGCSANTHCGHGLTERLGIGVRPAHVRALSSLSLSVGDTVVIGTHEKAVVQGALMMYGLPLSGLLSFALLADVLGFSEPFTIMAGGAGFLIAWLMVRRYGNRMANDPKFQPVVLKPIVADAAGCGDNTNCSKGE